MKRRVFTTFALLSFGLSFAACSSGGVAYDPSVQGAVDFAANPQEARAVFAPAGESFTSMFGALTDVAPALFALVIDPEADASAMLHRYKGSPGVDRDLELALLAAAVGLRGEARDLAWLAEALEASFDKGLRLTMHSLTHAIFLLLDDPALRSEILSYGPVEMEAAVAAARAVPVSEGEDEIEDENSLYGETVYALNPSRRTCVREVQILNDDGTPIYIQDEHGNTKPLTVRGLQFNRIEMSEQYQRDMRASVIEGGGTYVENLDGGVPNARFNCVGWSFRGLNDGNGWAPDVDKVYRDFMAAGLLERVYGTPAVGDKCFYFDDNYIWNGDVAKHVAEVETVDLQGNVTVRAPDSQSGVFDCDLNCQYVADKPWVPYCYRWAAGHAPQTAPIEGADRTDKHCRDDEPGEPPDTGSDEPEPVEDGDMIPAEIDNCPEHNNPYQIDSDGDGIGNDCDPTPCPTYEIVDEGCGGCTEGFYCSSGGQGTGACEQIECPENAGRTYTLECCCDCWEDKTYVTVYDPCRVNFVLFCAVR